MGSCYPFGLKHKGYNGIVSTNVNSIASKFGYNGIELEEALGMDLYEMDVRSYDPAIARWTSIDPVVHFDDSPYQAFDNNPVFWADPSGADSWTYIGNGIYRNDRTNEESSDWNRAISETKAHLEGNKSLDDIGRNENGEVVYVTDGTTITQTHPATKNDPSITAQVEIGYIFTNDGTPIKVYKFLNGYEGFKTDCHGLTFAEGKYWIDNDEVRKILDGDEYDDVLDGTIKKGDVVTQEDSSNNIIHSSTVSCTDGTCQGSTSFGIGGVQTEPIDRPIDETEKMMEDAYFNRIDFRNKFYRKLATDKVFTTVEIEKLRQKVYPKTN